MLAQSRLAGTDASRSPGRRRGVCSYSLRCVGVGAPGRIRPSKQSKTPVPPIREIGAGQVSLVSVVQRASSHGAEQIICLFSGGLETCPTKIFAPANTFSHGIFSSASVEEKAVSSRFVVFFPQRVAIRRIPAGCRRAILKSAFSHPKRRGAPCGAAGRRG